MECPATGNPPPEITWLKDGHVIQEDSNHAIQDNGAVFVIHRLEDSDAGNYECDVYNGIGEAIQRTFLIG